MSHVACRMWLCVRVCAPSQCPPFIILSSSFRPEFAQLEGKEVIRRIEASKQASKHACKHAWQNELSRPAGWLTRISWPRQTDSQQQYQGGFSEPLHLQ
jgi:hypothetical protein